MAVVTEGKVSQAKVNSVMPERKVVPVMMVSVMMPSARNGRTGNGKYH